MHDDHEPARRDWRIPDEFWENIEPLLPPRKPHPLGCHRPRVDDRQAVLGCLALGAGAVLRVLVVRAFEGHGPALVQRVLAHWPHRSLGEWIHTIDLRLARPYFFGVLLVIAVLAFVAVIFERREVYRRWVG